MRTFKSSIENVFGTLLKNNATVIDHTLETTNNHLLYVVTNGRYRAKYILSYIVLCSSMRNCFCSIKYAIVLLEWFITIILQNGTD